MSFRTDKQTLEDLMLFGRSNSRSVFEIFNHTHSRGAMRVMGDMFRNPLSDDQAIRKRVENISFFTSHTIDFPFTGEMFDALEFYLNNVDRRTQLSKDQNNVSQKLRNILRGDVEFAWIHNGIIASLNLLNHLDAFLGELRKNHYPDADNRCEELAKLLVFEEWKWYKEYKGKKKVTQDQAIELDRAFRFQFRDKLLRILEHIFFIDVYMSVASVAVERKYVFPEACPAEDICLKLKGVYHPLLDKPVGNDLEMDKETNVIFLTGANMAGKSTMMKTLSIALFLAHMGFPVPAQYMKFSVRNGMFTTINLPDNLNRGYSHFYTEVMRVKKVGENLNNTGRLIVLFDELFRGTNVKDAYDATLAVVQAFAKNRDSLFIISTHITEVGEALRGVCKNIRYLYMPTRMENMKPVYPYKLTEGITTDRHGLVIVNNEHIVEIIKGEYHDF